MRQMGILMQLNDLSPEQQNKASECKSPADILALAQEEGYELTDDELDQISGGSWMGSALRCPFCGSSKAEPQGMHSYRCSACNQVFKIS